MQQSPVDPLSKAQESWIVYRSTAETLMREYNLFMLKTGEYSEDNIKEDARRNDRLHSSKNVRRLCQPKKQGISRCSQQQQQQQQQQKPPTSS